MKCHYEVLNVARDANEGEIKTAYRKLALKWHPDKNPENPDLAKDQFQLVQQAYDVLGDSHERAWYDRHREQILYGGRNGGTYKDDSVDVFQYFTTSCFGGYGDDENGFYAVYKNVFIKIATEDIEYMDSEEEYNAVPQFGDSQSDYDEIVGPFYAYWTGYSTRKSYAWLDPYDIRETKDRKVVKLIEKENKKVRTKARKERNEEVRNLVAFVRKRDKRVQANIKKLEQKALENRMKQERIRRERIAERKKELSLAQETQQEWAKFDNMRSELEQIEKHLAEEFGEELTDSEESVESRTDDEDDGDDPLSSSLYCAACNKVFKTVRAFENHESSKKHKENVEKLKEQMLHEDDDFASDRSGSGVETNANDGARDSDAQQNDTAKCGKSKKKKKKKMAVAMFNGDDDGVDSENETNGNEFRLEIDGLSKKQKKKNRREENILASRNKVKEEKSADSPATTPTRATTTVDDDDDDCPDTILKNGHVNKGDESKARTKQNGARNTDRRANRSAATDVGSTCAVCKSVFPSKNKLFDHLKKTGHSVPLQEKIACANVVTKTNRKRK